MWIVDYLKKQFERTAFLGRSDGIRTHDLLVPNKYAIVF